MRKRKKLVGLLIGRRIKVIDSLNKSNIGIEGRVIDESKETLLLLCKGRKKRLIKKIIKFEIKNGKDKMR